MHIYQPMQYPSYTLEAQNGYYKYLFKNCFEMHITVCIYIYIYYTWVRYPNKIYIFPSHHIPVKTIYACTTFRTSSAPNLKPEPTEGENPKPASQTRTFNNPNNLLENKRMQGRKQIATSKQIWIVFEAILTWKIPWRNMKRLKSNNLSSWKQKSVQIGRFQIGSFRSQYPVMKQTCRVFGIMSISPTSMIN